MRDTSSRDQVLVTLGFVGIFLDISESDNQKCLLATKYPKRSPKDVFA